ncbi:ferritin-4, chloroplastic-like [Corylus avellana]|uniref:ferritin-4, chloroplastic-like n=1 Tax=Corylus avellana TaxID=13451 RepID=UPI00286A023D|nr:ferritin-4, chloroplastic-like [Corylus avellana]
MLLKAAPAVSLLHPPCGETLGPLFFSVSSPSSRSVSPLNYSSASLPSSLRFSSAKKFSGSVICLASKGDLPPAGVAFQPFEEAKKELDLIPTDPHLSLARKSYSDECEAAVNEQINIEFSFSYIYHAMFAYFDRDNVALEGLAKVFKDLSKTGRTNAEELMEYQNSRGGRVKLQSIAVPPSEYDHSQKGDALYAMELALSFEKLSYEKLLNLIGVAKRNHDAPLADFVENEFLDGQMEFIQTLSKYVAQLRKVGKGGHGVWHFDKVLYDEY